jgi:hypothetical protein
VPHLLDRRALEQLGERREALIVEVEVEVEVLVDSLQLPGDGLVQQRDALRAIQQSLRMENALLRERRDVAGSVPLTGYSDRALDPTQFPVG